jgi:glycosyltransferase involved in cell wall biosynthesis
MSSTARPLRVLRVIARLNIGGPARHVTVLDRGLRARGFETLLAHGDIGHGEGSLDHVVQAAAIPMQRIPGLGRTISATADLKAFLRLLRLVYAFEPDVIHTHTAKAGTLGRIAAALYNAGRPLARRCLVVHTFHGHVFQGYFGALTSGLVRWCERSLARLTDRIFVLSVRQRDEITRHLRVTRPGIIHIVPLGLDLGELLALAPERRGSASEFVFGYVGRFVPIKNVPALVEAFARVHAHRPRTRLLLAGEGETMPQVQALVRQLSLVDAVELCGWRHDLTDIYASIDALILGSWNEGTPVSVIEAMAAALPVVATRVGGVPDVVAEGRTGLLVEPGSVEQLAAAMRTLADDGQARRRIGLAARESVQFRFGADRLVHDVAAQYAAGVHEKRHGRALTEAMPG